MSRHTLYSMHESTSLTFSWAQVALFCTFLEKYDKIQQCVPQLHDSIYLYLQNIILIFHSKSHSRFHSPCSSIQQQHQGSSHKICTSQWFHEVSKRLNGWLIQPFVRTKFPQKSNHYWMQDTNAPCSYKAVLANHSQHNCIL